MHGFETSAPDLASTMTAQVEDINPELLRSQPTIARRMRAALNASRESLRLRDRRMNRDANTQDRHNSDWSVPPRVLYDSTLAGELRHVRDGLHDWVTEPQQQEPQQQQQQQQQRQHHQQQQRPPWLIGMPPRSGMGGRPVAGLPHETPSGPSDASTRSSGLGQSGQSNELRSAALTQALRRHSRMSPRSRIGLDAYMMERARRTDDGEMPEPSRPRLLRPPSMINASDRRHGIPTSELRSSVEAYRQRYLHNPAAESSEVGGPLDEAIKYLDRVRSSDSIEEGHLVAYASKIMNQLSAQIPFPLNGHDDLVVDTKSIPPPAHTSWLRIGSVFEGTQHAAGAPNARRRRLSPSSSGNGLPLYAPGRHGASHDDSLASSLPAAVPTSLRGDDDDINNHNINHNVNNTANNNNNTNTNNNNNSSSSMQTCCCCAGELEGGNHFDKWPVKVTIHSVDYDTMRLSGEMEAFDVPDRTAPECKSSITTYLEGEIIDLTQHTLETKNFRSSLRIDAIYWHKLLPFRGHDDVDIVQWLLSKKWLTEHISQEWVLMRWKGGSFDCRISCLLTFVFHSRYSFSAIVSFQSSFLFCHPHRSQRAAIIMTTKTNVARPPFFPAYSVTQRNASSHPRTNVSA